MIGIVIVIEGPNGFGVNSKSVGVDTVVKTAGASQSLGIRCGTLSGKSVGDGDGAGVGRTGDDGVGGCGG